MPDIQDGNYGLWLKTLENGKEVWRAMQGAGGADLSAYATKAYVQGFAPQKLTAARQVHIGGVNASDTDDLFNGRGDVDKPFATLEGAWTFVSNHYIAQGNNAIQFILHEDQVLPPVMYLRTLGNPWCLIQGDDTIRTITVGTTALDVLCVLWLQNVRLVTPAEGSGNLIIVDGINDYASLTIGQNVEFSGIAHGSVLRATWGGKIQVTALPTGTITGRKYECLNGSSILSLAGVDYTKLPGTMAGTCDESSIVA